MLKFYLPEFFSFENVFWPSTNEKINPKCYCHIRSSLWIENYAFIVWTFQSMIDGNRIDCNELISMRILFHFCSFSLQQQNSPKNEVIKIRTKTKSNRPLWQLSSIHLLFDSPWWWHDKFFRAFYSKRLKFNVIKGLQKWTKWNEEFM